MTHAESTAPTPKTLNILANIHLYSDDVLLTESEVAAAFSLSPRTLRNRRCMGRSYFPFIKMGGSIRYRLGDIRNALKALSTAAE
jgi:hypothetical protein